MAINLNSEPVDQVAVALAGALRNELPENVIVLPPSRARSFVIKSPDDRSVCSALLGDAKGKFKYWNERRLKRTRILDSLKRLIMDDYAPATTYYEDEIAVYTSTLSVWDREQERLERKRRAAAEAEAERLRQEEIRLAREAEAREKAETDRLLKKAERVAAEGHSEEADALINEASEREAAAEQDARDRIDNAAFISPASVAPAVERIGGESQSWKYWAELIDLDKVIKAVAEGRLPRSVLEFSSTGARKLAEGTGDDFARLYPEATTGVRLVKTPVYSHRRKRS